MRVRFIGGSYGGPGAESPSDGSRDANTPDRNIMRPDLYTPGHPRQPGTLRLGREWKTRGTQIVAPTRVIRVNISDERLIAALIGAASALGIAAGLLEPMGVAIGGVINAVAYSAWSLWLVWLGVLLLVGKNIFPGHAE